METPYDVPPSWRARALTVRWEHSDGRRCDECVPGMRCPRYAVWFPTMVQIDAERKALMKGGG